MILLLLALQQPITLGEAVTRAIADAPGVAIAALRSDGAAERERQARAALWPTLGASAFWMNRSFNRASLGITFPTAPGQPQPPDLVGPFDNVDARVRATQALFDWAAVSRLRAARAQSAGVAAEQAVVAEAAAHNAALAWLQAARAREVVSARIADSLLAADLVRLAEAQVGAGIAPIIDATRARTQLVAARGAVIVAQADRARTTIALARALGMEAEAAPVPADSLVPGLAASEVPAPADAAAAFALAHRPDLIAETARYSAARRGAAAISAERLPRLELAADVGLNGPAASDMIGTGQVAVQLSVPLFDGLRREGRLGEQRALARESQVRLRDLERQVKADVAAALLDVESANAQVAIAAERLRLAEAELGQARERFAAGVTGNIELITAQLALLDARDGAINARYFAAAARVALARAGGVARRLH